jgi:hypothetical protein
MYRICNMNQIRVPQIVPQCLMDVMWLVHTRWIAGKIFPSVCILAAMVSLVVVGLTGQGITWYIFFKCRVDLTLRTMHMHTNRQECFGISPRAKQKFWWGSNYWVSKCLPLANGSEKEKEEKGERRVKGVRHWRVFTWVVALRAWGGGGVVVCPELG